MNPAPSSPPETGRPHPARAGRLDRRLAAILVASAILTGCLGGSPCDDLEPVIGRVPTPPECSMSAAFPGGFPHLPPAITGGENRHDAVLVWESAVPLAEALDHYRAALGTEPFDGPDGPTFEAAVEGVDVVVVVNRDGSDAVTVTVQRR